MIANDYPATKHAFRSNPSGLRWLKQTRVPSDQQVRTNEPAIPVIQLTPTDLESGKPSTPPTAPTPTETPPF